MTRRRGGLSDDDDALWRLVTSTVRPLRGRARPAPRSETDGVQFERGPGAAVRAVRSDKGASKPPAPAPVSASTAWDPKKRRQPAPPPADRSAERRVRRGQVEVWGALDLHGLTQDQARGAVARFIGRAAAEGGRTIIVVTGKGGRFGGGEGVLRRRFPDWLSDPGVRGLVSGYSPAHPRHGGAGAFYVFLKRQELARDAFS